jgi:biotin carboxylase
LQSIIILGAGNAQIPVIKKAKDLGYFVVAIDRNANAPGFKYSDIVINESTYDEKKIISELIKLDDKYEFKGIVARTTGKPLLTAASISQKFNLSGLTNDVVSTVISKSKLREFCYINKIPFPEGQIITSKKEQIKIPYPIILKPDLANIGKSNIFFCSNHIELQKYFDYAYNASSNLSVELESFIDGIDVTCLCWANNGNVANLCWWDELVGITTDNQIVGIGVSIPSVVLNTIAKENAEHIVQKIVQKFYKIDALMLISFRITMDNTPYVIEIHLDLGGDLIAEKLFPSSNPNFDYFKTAIQISTNSIKDIWPLNFKPTAMYYMSNNPILIGSTDFRYGENLIIQKGSIKNNLDYAKEVYVKRKLDFKYLPKHKEWLSNIISE